MQRRGRNLNFRLALVTSLLLSMGLVGCCEKKDLELERLEGFVEGVGDIQVGFRSEWLTGAFAYSLDFWSGIQSFSQVDIFALLNINMNFGANATFQIGTHYFDIDNDAYKELVSVLVVTNVETREQFRFFQWKGDRFTLDKSQTYVGWVYGGSTVVVAANVGSSEGLVIVEVSSDASSEMNILACTDGYVCGTCDATDKLTSCIDDAEAGSFTSVVMSRQSSDTATEGDSENTPYPTDSALATDSADTDTGDSAVPTDTVDTVASPDTADTTASTDSADAVVDTASETVPDTATGGSADTSSSIGLDLNGDDTNDISIGFDGDTVTIGWGF